MSEGTYYEILGIDANSTEDDIRKAYRKQALLWHPDKNAQRKEEAEEKFKLIAEAYEVLSDPEKKQVYDLYGEEGLKNNGPSQDYDFRPQFHDPRDIFNSFFNGRDPFAEMFGNQFFGGGGGFGRMPGFGTRSPFDDDDGFFSGPFGNFGPSGSYSFSSSSSSSSSGGGQGGFVSRSISTKIVNGVTTTVTKTVDARGIETVTTETSDGKRQVLVNNQPQGQQRAIDDGRRTTNIPIQDGNSYYGQRQQPQPQIQPQYQQQPQQFQQFQQFQYPQHPQQSQQYQQYQQQRSMNQQQYQQPPFQQQYYQQQEFQDSTHPREGDHHKKQSFFHWPHRKH